MTWKSRVYEGTLIGNPKVEAEAQARITHGRFIGVPIRTRSGQVEWMPYTSRADYEAISLMPEEIERQARRKQSRAEWRRDDYLKRYPRICAHIICESLGYASPTVAACILKDADHNQPNWCEWVAGCFKADARPVIKEAVAHRRHHRGPMADYPEGLRIVNAELEGTLAGPKLASWF